jgi:hypothetical protein
MPDPSSDTDLQTDVDVAATPEVDAAESSTANGVEPKSMLEAVQSALKPAEPAPEKTEVVASPATGEPGAVEKPAEPAKPALDAYKEVPFGKHPRFRQLLKERNTFHAQLAERDAELAKLKESNAPQQETLQRFNAFANAVRSADLNAQEVNDGFAIMAAMKRDPEKALQMMQPYLEALFVATGRTLDADLSKKVADGVTDAETAGQLQRERHTRARLEGHTQRLQQTSVQADQQRQTDALVQSVTAAVEGWEIRQKTDPDYQKKQPLVIREINYLMTQEGYPQTPEAAVAMADKAKRTVESNLAALMPVRQPVRTVTGGAASAATVAARPKTLLEAARLAVSGNYTPTT